MASFFGIGRTKQKSASELARETKELAIRLAQERLGPDEKPSPKVRNLHHLHMRDCHG
jgi:calcium binding protein 39